MQFHFLAIVGNGIGVIFIATLREEIAAIREAYQIIFFGDNVLLENVDKAEKKLQNFDGVKEIVNFMRYKSSRSYCLPKGK